MLGDTIWAVSSAPGAAVRGVLRISGPAVLEAVAGCLGSMPRRRRAVFEAPVTVLNGRTVPGLVLVMPGPRSFTGEDVVELHLPGGPLLLETVGAQLAPHARPATPGEFTRRAFENGRLDLGQAEAVLALIHAESGEQARAALGVLQGGLDATLAAAREPLLGARALLEADLDFLEDETGTVDPAAIRELLVAGLERLARLAAAMPRARPGGDLLLLGRANAGKSSLCNALRGAEVMLVGDRPGTTRDVVAVEVAPGLRLLDAPGDLDDPDDAWDRAALAHRDRHARTLRGAVLVLDPTSEGASWPDAGALPVLAAVATRADLAPGAFPPPLGPRSVAPVFRVGCRSGVGVDSFRTWLLDHVSGGPAVGAGRAAGFLDRACAEIRTALEGLDAGLGGELVALEVDRALGILSDWAGPPSAEAVLDRLFGSFCLGK